MDEELAAAIAGCAGAHRRLEATLDAVDDDVARQSSRLPGWSVGHVLTHLARNAQSHVRMLEAALAGGAVEQYQGGHEQRSRDIDLGATRPATDLVADVRAANAALEALWARMTPGAWGGHGLTLGVEWPCAVLPFHRWREVEIHHVDLGLAYSPADWPSEYIDRELPLALVTLPDRLPVSARSAMLAWLVGRDEQPTSIDLAPWQAKPEYYQVAPGPLIARAPGADATS